MTNELLTCREVAALLHVDQTTVGRWIRAGALPAIRLPRTGQRERYRIRRSVVEALLTMTTTG